MDINGQDVVLTGATGGIGRAIAEKLSGAGARLILVARDEHRLHELARHLNGSDHRIVPADLSEAGGRQRVVDACWENGVTKVGLLINNAGINEFRLFEEQSAETIRRLIDVNLLGPILLSLELLPLLRQQAQARIINIGSTFGSIGYPGYSTYCASKFGLRGFTEALRREIGDSSARVSYVAPRATRTDLNTDAAVALNDELGTAMDDPSLVAEEVLQVIRGRVDADKYIGWPEKLFVRINAVFPALVDSSLRKQLPIIRRFASAKP